MKQFLYLSFIFAGIIQTAMIQTSMTEPVQDAQEPFKKTFCSKPMKIQDAFCCLITLESCAMRAQELKPQKPIESAITGTVNEAEFTTELPQHTFMQLQTFAPEIHTTLTGKLTKFHVAKSQKQAPICSEVFKQLPTIKRLVEETMRSTETGHSAFQLCEIIDPNSIWPQECTIENLRTFITMHRSSQNPAALNQEPDVAPALIPAEASTVVPQSGWCHIS